MDTEKRKGGPIADQRGVGNNAVKLTEELVLEIRHLHSIGVSQRAISRQTGVPPANIWAIVHRKSWSHI